MRRVVWFVPVLLLVVLASFALMHLLPGRPWDQREIGAGGEIRSFSPTEVSVLKSTYGLDKPLPEQFLRYGSHLVRGDFGISFHYEGQPVRDLMFRAWRYTAVLAGLAFIIAVVAGVGLGVLAATRRDSAIDHMVNGFVTMAASVPSFVVGIAFIVTFSVGLHHLTGGRFSLPDGGFALDGHLVLPVITLSLLPTAFLARLTRASVLETLGEDHVRMARARGVPERTVLLHHVVRNSLIPVVTALGPLLAHLLAGSVIVEELFGIPGLGRLFVDAAAARDYPTLLGVSVLFAVSIVVANLAVDLICPLLNPRIEPA